MFGFEWFNAVRSIGPSPHFHVLYRCLPGSVAEKRLTRGATTVFRLSANPLNYPRRGLISWAKRATHLGCGELGGYISAGS
jgi:hypothetical protein